MFQYIDMDKWERSSHFKFFQTYDNPFYNICVDVDVSKCYAFCKRKRISFSLSTIYTSCKAANDIEAFRMRLRDNKVIIHDVVHPSTTLFTEEKTFIFCFLKYYSDFSRFLKKSQDEINELKTNKIGISDNDSNDNQLHYSIVPWISFNSLTHARKNQQFDSTPEIVFGKYKKQQNQLLMPVSINVHHGFIDGYHLAQFFEKFQYQLDHLDELFKEETL